MKAEDLRLNNWVEIKDQDVKTYAQVEGIGNLQHVAGQLWSIEELEPIPLTEEWLLKFGFVKSKKLWDTFAHLDYWQLELEIDNKRIDNLMFRLDKYGSARAYTYDHIKHVHQLQNLIHAITGQELTIKE